MGHTQLFLMELSLKIKYSDDGKLSRSTISLRSTDLANSYLIGNLNGKVIGGGQGRLIISQ